MQVADEEIGAAAAAIIGFGGSVAGAGNEEEIEVLVSSDEGIDDLEGGSGIDIAIEFAEDEEEGGLKAMGVGAVGVLGVVRADRPTHPSFVPPDFVEAVVVTTAVGDGGAVEIAVEQDGSEGVLATGGAAVDADAREVEFGKMSGGGLEPGDAVGETGVGEIFPGDIVEGLGSPVGAHAVDLDDDEAAVSDFLLVAVGGGEAFGDVMVMRSGVDVFHHGEGLAGEEGAGPVEDAPDGGETVATGGDEAGGETTVGRQDAGGISLFQGADESAIGGAAEDGDRGEIDTRPRIEEEAAVGGPLDAVGPIAVGEEGQVGTVEVHAGEVEVVGVLGRVEAAGPEPDLAGLTVEMFDATDHPGSGGDGKAERTGVSVHEEQMIPTGTFGHPEDFASGIQMFDIGFVGVIDERGRGLIDDHLGAGSAGGPVEGDQSDAGMTAFVVEEAESGTVGCPAELFEAPGLGPGGGIDGQFLWGLNREGPQGGGGEGVAGFEIGIGAGAGLELVGGGGFDEVHATFGDGTGLDRDQALAVRGPIDFGQGGWGFGSLIIHAYQAVAGGVAAEGMGGVGVEGELGFVGGGDVT